MLNYSFVLVMVVKLSTCTQNIKKAEKAIEDDDAKRKEHGIPIPEPKKEGEKKKEKDEKEKKREVRPMKRKMPTGR